MTGLCRRRCRRRCRHGHGWRCRHMEMTMSGAETVMRSTKSTFDGMGIDTIHKWPGYKAAVLPLPL